MENLKKIHEEITLSIKPKKNLVFSNYYIRCCLKNINNKEERIYVRYLEKEKKILSLKIYEKNWIGEKKDPAFFEEIKKYKILWDCSYMGFSFQLDSMLHNVETAIEMRKAVEEDEEAEVETIKKYKDNIDYCMLKFSNLIRF